MAYLLATGVLSAGIAAAFTYAPQEGHPERVLKKSNKAGALDSNATFHRGTNEAGEDIMDVPPAEPLPPPTQEINEISIPSASEALALKRPDESPRADIVAHGPDALIELESCKSPAQLIESARSGPGMIGCEIEVPDSMPFIEGRALFRRDDGTLEVGDYEEGRRTGEWKRYFSTGVLASVGSYDQDQQDGPWHEYDRRGRHRITRHYVRGAKHGVTIRFGRNTADVALYFEGREFDPETKEPLSEGERAEAQ